VRRRLTRRAGIVSTRRTWSFVIGLGAALAIAAVVAPAAWAAVPPPLSVSAHGNLTDGQVVAVSVGSNGYFTPYAAVHILECSDPGGSAANLPKDDSMCDGNTIQGSTILVGANGAFADSNYPVYLLPSQGLGEQLNGQPICNQTHYCVLYVGQNQNDFTAPKVFSSPFLISAGPGGGTTAPSSGSSGQSASTGTGQTSGVSTPSAGPATPGASASSQAASAKPAVTLSASGALANTGPLVSTEWLALGGIGLLLIGTLGRRLALRRIA